MSKKCPLLPHAHGGDVLRLAAAADCAPHDVLDFSVNIRPEGAPDFVRAALLQALGAVDTYPSPHAEELAHAAAAYHGLDAACFVFGNGSNELIHALARTVKKQGTTTACIAEPAFSEYALAAERAGLALRRIMSAAEDTQAETLSKLAAGSVVFWANPSNPSGVYEEPERLIQRIRRYPDLLWVIDEAFVNYVGTDAACSLIPCLPENALVLRSLTKFYAVPGVRLGYLVGASALVQAVQAEIPAWSVNAFAMAAATAIFSDTSDFAEQTRRDNQTRRTDLVSRLASLDGVTVFPSCANYVLFRWPQAVPSLQAHLLRSFGIAVRDCSNYHGLEDNTWFRVAVRTAEDHQRLCDALDDFRVCCVQRPEDIAFVSASNASSDVVRQKACVSRKKRKKKPALMLQGTSSDAGKSILTAAYCRILRQDGYRVAPFKAQNMSLNSGVTALGDEMGRAQIVQAQAAGLDPDARMNPILLKPHSDTGSQVIVLGQPIGHMSVQEYFSQKIDLRPTVHQAYDELAEQHDVMVLEGAGSPGEINLKKYDLVNMHMADYARAAVLLVGDIDRGGVYASLLGTWMTFEAKERDLLFGYLINKFRGDASLLAPAHEYLLRYTGKSVLGVIPYLRDINLPEEDMAGFSAMLAKQQTKAAPTPEGVLDIAVVMLRHVSNYTDMAPLAAEPDVVVRPVRRLEDWGNPHVVLIPGSKSVVPDLDELHRSGLAQRIQEHGAQGKWVFGICGGLQILGESIFDPYGVESSASVVSGLGLLKIRSTFAKDKTLIKVSRAETPLGVLSGGYEIHHGVTEHASEAQPLFLRADRCYDSMDERVCGYVTNNIWATYLHGVFDDDGFRRAWLDHVRCSVGLKAQGQQLTTYDLEKSLDALADVVREQTDMTALRARLGL